ncbi:putative ribonuclease YokI [Calidithermus terrae]|uniref:Putative ribonuclease YokI n=1 Tax=Calidithermus terrae TaxID=1408545 RepID=A0A399EVW9_9DEIN|nr:polymorphic toxin-type HINT domain-containing protein [Calidithermus terrae]RIH86692.1 putative ribonuclease YokI [Calidithermus terrae]
MDSPDFRRIEAQFNQAALGLVGPLGVPLTAADLAVTAGVTLGGRAAAALARLLPGRTAGVASRAVNAVDTANCPNSFSPETKVATAAGMAAIAAVVAGTPVLAYNEQTGKNEYRPVLEQVTQGVTEKRVTYLTLRDDESGLTETLTTTKGHPYNHHPILDKWAAANIPGYVSRKADAPTIALTLDQHKAAHAVQFDWLEEVTGKRTFQGIDWTKITPRQIDDLMDRMYAAAGVPESVRMDYRRVWNQYIYEGRWSLPCR